MTQTEFLERLGNNIKELRTARGLHLGIMADKLGIPLKGIEGIEAGHVAMTITDLYDIASLLEVDPKELFA